MAVYSDNGMPLHNRKEQTTETHNSMNEPHDHYAERDKPNPRDGQTRIWVPTLPLPGCVALDELLNLSEPQLPPLGIGEVAPAYQRVLGRRNETTVLAVP